MVREAATFEMFTHSNAAAIALNNTMTSPMQLRATQGNSGQSMVVTQQTMHLKLQENWTIYEAGYNAAIQQNVHNLHKL